MKVEFHSGVGDKLEHACRFVRKAQAAGARLVVGGDAAQLDRLDAALWTFDAHSFVPHVRLRRGGQPTPRLRRTPTWLADDVSAAPDTPVLVNLGPDIAQGWQRFERVIEIVGSDAAEADAGRMRWRHYQRAEGVELVHHKVGASR